MLPSFSIKQKWSNRGCATYDPSEYIFYGLAYFDHFGGDEPHYADRTLNITRFGSGFLLIIIGIVISCCILLGEIFYAKRRGTAVSIRPCPMWMPAVLQITWHKYCCYVYCVLLALVDIRFDIPYSATILKHNPLYDTDILSCIFDQNCYCM